MYKLSIFSSKCKYLWPSGQICKFPNQISQNVADANSKESQHLIAWSSYFDKELPEVVIFPSKNVCLEKV